MLNLGLINKVFFLIMKILKKIKKIKIENIIIVNFQLIIIMLNNSNIINKVSFKTFIIEKKTPVNLTTSSLIS